MRYYGTDRLARIVHRTPRSIRYALKRHRIVPDAEFVTRNGRLLSLFTDTNLKALVALFQKPKSKKEKHEPKP